MDLMTARQAAPPPGSHRPGEVPAKSVAGAHARGIAQARAADRSGRSQDGARAGRAGQKGTYLVCARCGSPRISPSHRVQPCYVLTGCGLP